MGKVYSRIDRLLKLVTLVQGRRGLTAARLAEACGVAVRTIYRDLQTLQASGVPIHHDPDTDGYRIHGEFFLPPVQLSLDESLALIVLAEGVGGDGQLPLTGAAARAAEKVRGQLPGAIRGELDAVTPNIAVQLARSEIEEVIEQPFERIRQAIATGRALRCTYDALHNDLERDPPEAFLFRPYALLFNQRAWYAVGHHDRRDALRCLKLNRFLSLLPTDTPYAVPEDFSLEGFVGKAWRMIRGDRAYRVVLWFDAGFAENVSDTHWHDTQEIEDLDDGSIRVRFEVDGLDEIVWWVLGYGPHCRVEAPPELIERVAELSRATAEQYEGRADGAGPGGAAAGEGRRGVGQPDGRASDAEAGQA